MKLDRDDAKSKGPAKTEPPLLTDYRLLIPTLCGRLQSSIQRWLQPGLPPIGP